MWQSSRAQMGALVNLERHLIRLKSTRPLCLATITGFVRVRAMNVLAFERSMRVLQVVPATNLRFSEKVRHFERLMIPASRHSSNENTCFQSFLMLTIVQPCSSAAFSEALSSSA